MRSVTGSVGVVLVAVVVSAALALATGHWGQALVVLDLGGLTAGAWAIARRADRPAPIPVRVRSRRPGDHMDRTDR